MTTTCLPCELAAETDAAPETGKAVWSGPIGIENQRTGDGRFIEPNALRWDTLPIPLRWAMQDFGAHDGAYVVGKIEEIERLSYGEANERLEATGRDPLPESFGEAVIIWGSGTHDLGSEHGREAYRQTDEGLTPGISMDLDDIVIKEEDDDAFSITEGRIRAATQVAIPAFEGARISTEKVEALEASEEAFNWVEDAGGLPEYIKRIEKHLEKKGMTESHAIATAVNVVKKMCATGDLNFPGAQEVNAGSRAEACKAVADWERKKAQAGAAVTASAGKAAFRHDWFQDPRLNGSTEWTVTDEGRVFGYLALFGTCHIANPQGPKVCTQPPRSPSNYAYFNTQPVRTDRGFVHAGRLTMNTLHAGQRLSSNDTIYHYEHTGAVGAYVVAGEDEFGIWVAGAAHPGADRDSLRAAPVSGDWRTIAGHLEMVAALSVNVPGFPIPRATALVASGEVYSLVASGMVEREERHEAMQALGLDDPAVLRGLRERFREMDRADAATALAARVNRLAALERVRRVARAVGAGYNGKMQPFAYDPDQWRMPKGNPDAGQWIDMPDVSVAALADALDSSGVTGLEDSVADARTGAADAADAIRAGDGPAAVEAARVADAALADIEADVKARIEGGEVEDIGLSAAVDAARADVARVADADLSLLGDKGLGGEDIGGGDVVGRDGKPIAVGDKVENSVDPAQSGTVVGFERGLVQVEGPDGVIYGYRPAQLVQSVGESAVAGLAGIDPADREAQQAALDGLPAGSVVELDDGEYVTTLRKNADGTWGVLSSGLADMEDPELAPLTSADIMGEDLGPEYPLIFSEGDPDAEPQWADLYDEKAEYDKAEEANAKEAEEAGKDPQVLKREKAFKKILKPGEKSDTFIGAQDMKPGDEVITGYPSDPQRRKVASVDAEGNVKFEDGGSLYKAMGAYKIEKENGGNLSAAARAALQTAVFAYNPDQWRVPKGNGELSGRFVDMPDAGVNDLDASLGALFEGPAGDDPRVAGVGESLNSAVEAAERSSSLLKEGDGDGAKAAAVEADEHLSKLEGQLTDLADDGTIDDATAASVGEKLDVARTGVATVKDSDLSLLGDEGVGGDAPETDIGAEGEEVVGDAAPAAAPEAPAAVGSEQQKAGSKAADTSSKLEGTLMDAADAPDGIQPEDAEQVGDALAAFQDAMDALNDGVQGGNYDAADLSKAQSALQQLEAVMMDVADRPGLSDDRANQIGVALDDMFSDLGDLAASLQGSTEPPPFAARRYVRQWLGRRGIRTGRRPTVL